MKFTDFYVAASICTPSRAALMTGCYPLRVGLPTVLHPETRLGLHENEITIAEILKRQGYATMCVGKWHLGHRTCYLPTRHGFDRYFGIPYSNDKGFPPLPPTPLMRDEEVIEQPAQQPTLTERYTEEAVRFIKENGDRPFFLYLAHTMPHVPLSTTERFRGKSERGLYGDVIACIDWSVGVILDTLKELELEGDTLVVFTSDNGPWLVKGENGGCALPLRDGKISGFEGGFRVPCVMRWPGTIPAGSTCSEVATTMDFLPTFARLAGSHAPSDRIIDGKDIRPLIMGEPGTRSPYEAFYYYTVVDLRAVRSGKWKLMYHDTADGEVVALYDLEDDIGETKNVITEHPQAAARLEKLAELAREDLGDARTMRDGKNRRPSGRIPPG